MMNSPAKCNTARWRTKSSGAVSVAELTMGLALALARKTPAADRDTRAGQWNRKHFTGIELHRKTLGVVGFGRIGFLTAMRAKALGMRVVTHDPYVDPDSVLMAESDAQLLDLEKLLERSDVVCCHLPCTTETRGLFNAKRFARMKSGALFVNTARGEIVDESALIEALTSGRISGAALDVRIIEPPGFSPLCQMDQVILTPHIGAFTREAQERVVAAVCRDVTAVLNGRAAQNAINLSTPRRDTNAAWNPTDAG